MKGFSHSSVGKESACNVGDPGSIPGLGRSPREGKGYPLQYSGLENSMDCRRDRLSIPVFVGFPCGSAGKESACSVGDLGWIPGMGRSPGEGKGYPLQYSGLENFKDCVVHGVPKSWTWLSDLFHFTSLTCEKLRERSMATKCTD